MQLLQIGELCEDFDPTIDERYLPAFETRQANFGKGIGFYAPAVKSYETDEFSNCGTCSFAGFSVTGAECSLRCDHCQTAVLAPMAPAVSPEKLFETAKAQKAAGSGGMLISGGSDKRNRVPLDRYFDTMSRIRSELDLKILVHVGFVDEAQAKGLAAAGVDSVMLDIIGADETVAEVYHLPWASTDNYRRSLANLADAGLPMSPHIVIGLHYGEIRGEYKALEIISEFAPALSSLVLVGLQPIVGTPMEHTAPPTPDEMGEVFRAARLQLPTTQILLGCERPHGEHKLRTDELALKAGLNGVAYPAEGIIGLARALGLEPSLSGFCCSLKFQGV